MGAFLTGSGPAPSWRGFDDVVARVRAAPPRLGRVRLVVVDGPAGSGKTTFAAALGAALSREGEVVAMVHLDDLYEGWSGLDGVWDRLTGWVLDPLSQGEPGRYRRYDWAAGVWAEWQDVPVPGVLVVEGCGSAPRAVDPLAVLRVWIEAPESVRLERGVARDGAGLRDRWLEWMAREAVHFARERTRERADVLLST
jgi:uridine kinase